MRKVAGLKLKHLFKILWWCLTNRYKAAVFHYYKEKGMYDLFAFNKADEMTRKEAEVFYYDNLEFFKDK